MSATAVMATAELVDVSEDPIVELITGADAAPRSRTARELTREARALLASVDGLVSVAELTDRVGLMDLADRLADLAGRLSSQLFSEGTRTLRPEETMRLLSRVQELRAEISAHRTRRVMCRQRAVASALRELRAVGTLDQLFKLAPSSLCECGFSRAWISAVHRDSWRLISAHPADSALARRAARCAAPAPLLQDSPEAEVLRRRRPLLIADTTKQRTLDPLIEETCASDSYVLAPLVIDTRVVAFLHADRPASDAPLDEDDRDVLTLFAEVVSQTVQRVMLSERLERIRMDVSAATRSVEQLVEDRCCEAMTLAAAAAGSDPDAATEDCSGRAVTVAAQAASGYVPAPSSSRLAGLLTARELEVLGLMAGGETNASIARELVISEGTVKSHVKSILRKLRVANRAQAVSRYFRVIRAEDAA